MYADLFPAFFVAFGHVTTRRAHYVYDAENSTVFVSRVWQSPSCCLTPCVALKLPMISLLTHFSLLAYSSLLTPRSSLIPHLPPLSPLTSRLLLTLLSLLPLHSSLVPHPRPSYSSLLGYSSTPHSSLLPRFTCTYAGVQC